MTKEKTNINTVLFDAGGVLTPDPMETILFTPEIGLVDKLKLDEKLVRSKMMLSYDKFSTIPRSLEKDFWKDLGNNISTEIPIALVKKIEKELILPNPQAKEAITLIKDKGLKVGIISNNSSFWYDKQVILLELQKYSDPSLIFLSHQYGAVKARGLLKYAAEKLNPKQTLIIDDRPHNIKIAKELGFNTALYSMVNPPDSLISLLKSQLNLD